MAQCRILLNLMTFHGNTMITMEFLRKFNTSQAFHKKFSRKPAKNNTKFHIDHMEYHDTPCKLHIKFSTEKNKNENTLSSASLKSWAIVSMFAAAEK